MLITPLGGRSGGGVAPSNVSLLPRLLLTKPELGSDEFGSAGDAMLHFDVKSRHRRVRSCLCD